MKTYIAVKQELGGWTLEHKDGDEIKKSAHTATKNVVNRIFSENKGLKSFYVTIPDSEVKNQHLVDRVVQQTLVAINRNKVKWLS